MRNLINWFLHKDGHLDWLKHDILGTIIYLIILILMEFKQDDLMLSATVGFFTSVLAAFIKEMYDRKKGKEPSAKDMLWTVKTPLIISLTIIIWL